MPSTTNYPLAEVEHEPHHHRRVSQPHRATSAFIPGAQPTQESSSSSTSNEHTYNGGDVELLEDELYPKDSYYKGTYWADLPRAERAKWAIWQSNQEAKREARVLWSMTKKDPLSPTREYFQRYVIPGMGLFTEGSTLFSIGNLKPLFQAVWPACWDTGVVCQTGWVNAIEYLEILGIIVGQILVGFEGDWVGRKFGLVQDALIMTLGLVMLTASWGVNLNGWVICYGWSLFFYGIGVGGEYPMTATTVLESKAGVSPEQMRDDRLHRGRNVALTFLMQGWGQLFNQVILIVLLIIFHHGSGNPPYSTLSVQWTFRVQFGVVGLMTLWLAYHRYYRADYSMDAKLKAKKRKQGAVTGYDVKSFKLLISHFGGRLIGTTGCWFAADFFFYGSKLFQSTFIKVIIPTGSTVMDGWLYNLINIAVSLVGYYLAALLMDHKLYGRVRMQAVGFLMMFLLFVIASFLFNDLVKPQHIHAFQAIYYLSSFFTQFGSNSTTFLLAGEVYPTPIRATAHGLSAAAGKVGALLPAIIYNYVDVRAKFLIVTWFGLLGFFLTVVFIPDTTGLDLREQERYWALVRAGRGEDYHGIAVHRRHLSAWEIYVLKRHLAYDPVKDREAKVVELTAAYAKKMQEKADEVPADEQDEDTHHISDSVAQYFEQLDKKTRNAALAAAEKEINRQAYLNSEKDQHHVPSSSQDDEVTVVRKD